MQKLDLVGIDFIPNKKIALNKEQQEELAFISKLDKNGNGGLNGSHATASVLAKCVTCC